MEENPTYEPVVASEESVETVENVLRPVALVAGVILVIAYVVGGVGLFAYSGWLATTRIGIPSTGSAAVFYAIGGIFAIVLGAFIVMAARESKHGAPLEMARKTGYVWACFRIAMVIIGVVTLHMNRFRVPWGHAIALIIGMGLIIAGLSMLDPRRNWNRNLGMTITGASLTLAGLIIALIIDGIGNVTYKVYEFWGYSGIIHFKHMAAFSSLLNMSNVIIDVSMIIGVIALFMAPFLKKMSWKYITGAIFGGIGTIIFAIQGIYYSAIGVDPATKLIQCHASAVKASGVLMTISTILGIIGTVLLLVAAILAVVYIVLRAEGEAAATS